MSGTLRIHETGGFGRIELDGHDIAKNVRGVTVKLEAGEAPRVVLELSISEVEITTLGDSVSTFQVSMDEDTARVLQALGWLPPETQRNTYTAQRAWTPVEPHTVGSPFRDDRCTCPETHDPFQLDRHHETCYHEANSPDAND